MLCLLAEVACRRDGRCMRGLGTFFREPVLGFPLVEQVPAADQNARGLVGRGQEAQAAKDVWVRVLGGRRRYEHPGVVYVVLALGQRECGRSSSVCGLRPRVRGGDGSREHHKPAGEGSRIAARHSHLVVTTSRTARGSCSPRGPSPRATAAASPRASWKGWRARRPRVRSAGVRSRSGQVVPGSSRVLACKGDANP